MRIRPLQDDDAAAFAEGAADPAVLRYGHLPESDYTPASVRAMIARDAVPGLAHGNLAVLAVVESTTNAFAGSVVLFDVNEHSAEVGFWVHQAQRGCGIAVVALNLAARFAQASGLDMLTARTLPENPASQRALTGAGFTLDHRNVETAPSGHRVELLHYSRAVREG